MPRVRSAVLVSIVLAAVVAPAQEPPSFPSAVEMVTVDVVVVDEKGRPVTGLTRDDFELREEGRRQEIVTFDAVDLAAPEPAAAAAPVAAPAAIGPVATNAAARKPARTFVVVFDDAHMSPATAKRAREAVSRFLAEAPAAGDAIVLLPTGRGAPFTALRPEGDAALQEAIARLEGLRIPDTSKAHLGEYEACLVHLRNDEQAIKEIRRRWFDQEAVTNPLDVTGPGGPRAAVSSEELDLHQITGLIRARASDVCQQARSRRKAALDGLAATIAKLEGVRGRKTVMMVSEGFLHEPDAPEFRRVQQAARAANAAVYFLDARGLFGSPSTHDADVSRMTDVRELDTLLDAPARAAAGAETVAADSGGFTLRNSNDLAAGLSRIANESRSYYLLGYRPAPGAADQFREIAVDVKRDGVTVRARKGYYPASPAAAVDPMKRAAEAVFDEADLPARIAAYLLGPGRDGRTNVLFVGETDPSSPALAGAPTVEALLALSGRAAVQREAKIDLMGRAAMERSFELPPGGYTVRFVVRDPRSGRLGSARRTLDVPAADAFRMTTPILTDQLVAVAGGEAPVPTAHRLFPGSSKLIATFDVLGAARDEGAPRVSVAARVQDEAGRVLAEQPTRPLPPAPDGTLRYTLTLPLQGTPGGRYDLVLAVRDDVSGRALERREPFVVDAPRVTAAGPPPSPQAWLDLVARSRTDVAEAAAVVAGWVPAEAARVADQAKGQCDDGCRRAGALLHFEAGRRLARSQPDAASVHFERGKELAGRAGDDFERRFAYLLGLHALAQSRFEDAERAFQSATKGPRAAEAWVGLGTVAEARLRLAPPLAPVGAEPPPVGSESLRPFLERASQARVERRAEEFYRKALEADPELEEAHLRLGRVLADRNASHEATAELRRVVGSSDTTRAVLARLVLGDLLSRNGQRAAAVAHYRAAVERDPLSQTAHVALAHALLRSGKRAEAQEVMRKAATLGEPPPDHLDGVSAYMIGPSRGLDEVLAALRGGL